MATSRPCASCTRLIVALLIGLAMAVPPEGAAQSSCVARTAITTQTRWAPPLNRPITLRAGTVPLKEALDQLATAAALRVSYSREQLPLTRSVCMTFKGVAVGDVLTTLLQDVPVEAV